MRHALIFSTALLIGAAAVSAQPLRVDITEGASAPLQISLATAANVSDGNAADPALGRQLLQVVQSDLLYTEMLKLIPPAEYGAATLATALTAARGQGSQGLVWLLAMPQADQTLKVECSYVDVFTGSVEASSAYTLPAQQYRRGAHKCADLVLTHTSGEPSHFDTNLAIISERGSALAPQRQVTIIDSDGYNPREISPPAKLASTPAISRDGRLTAYLLVADNAPLLVLQDRATGTKRTIVLNGSLPSMPTFSPDGNALLFTLSRAGDADVFRYDLATETLTQLTRTFGTDTAAHYSPDGSKIIFQSDRSGQPQLYLMDADGSNQHRVSFGAGAFTTPVWSPRGDLLAFTHVTSTGMQIGTMRPDGSAIRLLPAPWQDESPAWAPSGRLLVFTRNLSTGPAQLWLTDPAGKRQRQLQVPVPASQASWSGLLP